MMVETHSTLSSTVVLFATMLVLAVTPSVSVFAVSARSAAFGFEHGVLTTAGIVAGDIVFIVIAIYGLVVIADLLGPYASVIRYIGGAYLIWLGIRLWRCGGAGVSTDNESKASLLASFLTGLLITLGDQKAILFYLGLFPAFLDLSSMSFADVGIVILTTAAAVGGAKLVYAYMAGKAALHSKNSLIRKGLNLLAGGVLVIIGVVLIAADSGFLGET